MQAVLGLLGGGFGALRLATYALGWAAPPQVPATLQQLANVVGCRAGHDTMVVVRQPALAQREHIGGLA